MSTIEVQKPPPPFLLDSFPPDTRVVVAGVSWLSHRFGVASYACGPMTSPGGRSMRTRTTW